MGRGLEALSRYPDLTSTPIQRWTVSEIWTYCNLYNRHLGLLSWGWSLRCVIRRLESLFLMRSNLRSKTTRAVDDQILAEVDFKDDFEAVDMANELTN